MSEISDMSIGRGENRIAMPAIWRRQNAVVVVNAALRVLGNATDAEDVAQDVFVEAFQRWMATTNHRWSGLLRRMAVCRALDQLRRIKRTDSLPEVACDPLAAEPVETAVARELEERLRHALNADDVIKAYGEPDHRVGLTAKLPNGRLDYVKKGLRFGFFNGRLSNVQVLGPQLRPNMQGILTIRVEKKQ